MAAKKAEPKSREPKAKAVRGKTRTAVAKSRTTHGKAAPADEPTEATKRTPARKKTAPTAPKRALAAKTSRRSSPAPKRAPAAKTSRKRAPTETSATSDALSTYRQMRSFDVTSEPKGAVSRPTTGTLQFVVQKHDASHLHYDFRLELDGVLLSWSVPKGPSLKAGERRLAVRTEDHPLEYARFEGTIPKGQYGGGSVIVWDRGTWTPEGDARKNLDKGKLTFELTGEKLSGRFHLVRSNVEGSKRENWLLLKGKDASASGIDVVEERPESVLSGKTVGEVGEEADAEFETERATPEPVSDMVGLVKRLNPGFALTHLEKVLFPEQGLRKAELIAYYVSVASMMLPLVENRPLVLVRCPGGHGEKCFYQKHIADGVPACVQRIQVKESKKTVQYAAVRDMNGLIALAQLGVLEVHLWQCHADDVEKPDMFVFDLDPAEGLPWQRVVDAALELKTRLSALGLVPFVKTTGGKGLHVVTPLKRKLTWDEHRQVSASIVGELAREQPHHYLINMRKDLRKGKIFLDYLRNGRGATAIAPYSTRAREGAPVAMPLRWDEVESSKELIQFDVRAVLRRLEAQKIDPWAEFNASAVALSAADTKRLTR